MPEGRNFNLFKIKIFFLRRRFYQNIVENTYDRIEIQGKTKMIVFKLGKATSLLFYFIYLFLFF